MWTAPKKVCIMMALVLHPMLPHSCKKIIRNSLNIPKFFQSQRRMMTKRFLKLKLKTYLRQDYYVFPVFIPSFHREQSGSWLCTTWLGDIHSSQNCVCGVVDALEKFYCWIKGSQYSKTARSTLWKNTSRTAAFSFLVPRLWQIVFSFLQLWQATNNIVYMGIWNVMIALTLVVVVISCLFRCLCN